MRKLLPLAAIGLLAVSNVSAQSLTAGLRSGVSCWSQRAPKGGGFLEATPGKHLSWDKELFLRREGRGRWAFEAGVSHSALTDRRQISPIINHTSANQTLLPHMRTRRSDNLELTLSAQYDITCSYMKACPLMKRFRSYVGASVTPALTKFTESTDFGLVDGVNYRTETDAEWFQTWIGLSHTMQYEATPHLVLSTVVEGRAAPTELLSGPAPGYEMATPAARFSFRIGAGYRF